MRTINFAVFRGTRTEGAAVAAATPNLQFPPEMIVVPDHDEATIEHGSDNAPVKFDDGEEARTMWRDFHEQFNAPFAKAEMEILDSLEIPYDPETGRDPDE